ncbi:MAG TPA: hypothetical protein VLE49_09020 [Anaerolineales bacterium]|nr:hypothetical protein [Anaerolineales bacterium]
MPESQYRARQVGAKTQEVVAYHQDASLPGKPLHILIPGGLVALGSLAVIVLVAYLTWFEGRLDRGTGLFLIALLAPFYIGGVFLFSYGYELYNLPRAIRLTAIIVFVTIASVVIVAVLFFVLGSGNSGSSSSRKKSSSGKAQAKPVSSSSAGGSSNSGPWVLLNSFGGSSTGGGTREVVREVEVPVAPRAVDCPFCGRSYVPADQNYACPACGAATPPELIEQSQAPKDRPAN